MHLKKLFYNDDVIRKCSYPFFHLTLGQGTRCDGTEHAGTNNPDSKKDRLDTDTGGPIYLLYIAAGLTKYIYIYRCAYLPIVHCWFDK